MFYDELSRGEASLRLQETEAKLDSIQRQRELLDEVEAIVLEHKEQLLRVLGVIVLNDHRPNPDAEWIG